MGDAAQDTYRLFMVPGMFHCEGGVGADEIDAMAAVINWVEAEQAPDQLVAGGGGTEGTDTVLLCPHPQQAVYSGTGEPLDAANWSCSE